MVVFEDKWLRLEKCTTGSPAGLICSLYTHCRKLCATLIVGNWQVMYHAMLQVYNCKALPRTRQQTTDR